jgi:hypothetical protein
VLPAGPVILCGSKERDPATIYLSFRPCATPTCQKPATFQSRCRLLADYGQHRDHSAAEPLPKPGTAVSAVRTGWKPVPQIFAPQQRPRN